MNLAYKIINTKVKNDEVAIFWLGQAGFVIKDSEDRVIAIDPYLTDCCERLYGFKRITPKLIAPHELEPDILITTHHHEDHLDIDAVPIIMANSKTRLIGSVTAVNKCLEMRIDRGRLVSLKPGDEVEIDGVTVKAIYADHGELAPDAVGVLLKAGSTKIYFTGDTSYDPDRTKMGMEQKPDIIILPINGQYGNLNSEEAAKLVRDIGAEVAIPCHFWTFIVHRGDPQEFENEMKKYAPGCVIKFLHQGEMFRYKGE